MAQGSGLLLSVSPRAILLFCVAAVVTLTFYTSHTIHLLTDRLDGVTRLNQQLEKKLALASALVKHHRSVTRLARSSRSARRRCVVGGGGCGDCNL